VTRALLAALVLAALSAPAGADDKPWVTGVSEENKAAAKVLLDQGNARFIEHDYTGALDNYKAAVARWEHPAIRFNMVRCFIQLDRALEAIESLELALKYGADPLEEAVYNEALAYQKLLANEVGTITVRCDQAGVAVSLDGDALLTCPGEQTRRVKPGKHQLLGSRTGFLTKSADVFVVGGATERASLSLEPLERAGKLVHRWSTWVPWLVVGAGLTVTGIGGLIEYQSYQTMDDYDRALVPACFDTGCDAAHPLPASIAATKDRAELQNTIAIGVITVGVATVISGGVLVYLNRARTVYPTAEHIDVTPTSGGAAVSLRGRF
jgi:tetratricopeptide (TPR) repeat protein